jgi:4-diphosphocytidyl-2-C-methyl-D-erythritol kinase
VTAAPAPAKLNLALVVGPRREDGRHQLMTLLQRIALADTIALEPAPSVSVSGFAEDTLVRSALESLARAAGDRRGWAVAIEKRIPVAAGLGGGSSDAATALRLANETLDEPLSHGRLHALAADLGADVPFFLRDGPQLGEGDGTTLRPIRLPQDYSILIVLPEGAAKASTGAVYDAFDTRGGERGYEERSAALLAALERVERPEDLAGLPPNDLASSPLAARLHELGAFRADATGAGPAVYGLFADRSSAASAARAIAARGRVWLTEPAW